MRTLTATYPRMLRSRSSLLTSAPFFCPPTATVSATIHTYTSDAAHTARYPLLPPALDHIPGPTHSATAVTTTSGNVSISHVTATRSASILHAILSIACRTHNEYLPAISHHPRCPPRRHRLLGATAAHVALVVSRAEVWTAFREHRQAARARKTPSTAGLLARARF
ncbi:hypothetical protein B0H13DRAFT_2321925 [Mycena leptocephala]|nr:hypothetical protein B0H13DRAFT_2321925 [Mycena leptocephala]